MKFIIPFLFLFVSYILAQSVELIHADKHLSRVDKNGKIERVLVGHVLVRRDTVTIKCDRAVFKENPAYLELIGKVNFITPSRNLKSDYAIYFEKSNKAELKRNIFYWDDELSLTTSVLFINFTTNKLYAPENTRVRRYDDGSVTISDSAKVDFSKKDYLFLGNAQFTQSDSSSQDLTIYADRFAVSEMDGKRKISAIRNVRFISGDLHANCDSSSYLYPGGDLILLNDPRAYWQLDEMVGDTMIVKWDEETRNPKLLKIIGQAEVFSPLDSLKIRENYLSGGEIIAKLRASNKLDWIEARDNATSRYYIDNDDGLENGLNSASSDTIRLYMKENAVDSVAIIGGIEGKYLPR